MAISTNPALMNAGAGFSRNPIQQLMATIVSLFMGLLGGGMMANLLNPQGSMPMQNPGFGGCGSCGCGGGAPGGAVSNFLGAPSAGYSGGGGAPGVASPGFGGSTAPMADMGAIQGGTPWGRALAEDARRNATGPGGLCYKYVAQALGRHGVNVSGASAYMAADQLAQNPKFREVRVPPNQLKSLPPGAVVVWNKGPGHPHGHVSIALGDGKEASDKIRNQITNYGTSVRVFLPKG